MIDLKQFGVDENILAHTPNETFKEHSDLTFEYFKRIKNEKGLDELIDKLIYNLDKKYFDLIKEMFESAIYLHDLGKTNKHFQANKMNNPHQDYDKFRNSSISTEHSLYSKIEYLSFYNEKLKDIERKEKDKLQFILYSFSYHIAKHHGKLSIFEDYDDKCISFFRHLKKYNIEPFEFYILNKLLFSLLVSSDYYATTEYMADLPIDNFGTIKDKQEVIDKFEEYHIIKNIRSGKNLEGINILRSQMFLESEENLLKNGDKNIFYLEAPTGSGKTLTSINLAMKLIKQEEINKIFYVFPFNTLVEQTKNQLDNIFGDKLNIEVINSISPIKYKEEDQEKEESKYQESYMGRLFFHNELILTTHISFFDILFGTSKEDNFPLWQLANSVIILDEIQSYDNKLWSYMIKFFSIYSKALNMKIIIMSATLPKLDELMEEKENIFEELIKNKDKYFQSEYFKSRVELDFSLLEEYDEIEDTDILVDKLNQEKEKYSKIVFEFIKKDSARDFFNKIEKDERFSKFKIYELSGDDNKATRELVIDKIKNPKEPDDFKIILVATQVIEAGVDIDMDLGFKDISTIDSEEQFLGRINRSCLKLDNKYKPKVYFFNKDDENIIYKKDNRIEDNLRKDEFKKVLLDKNFENFYKGVFKRIKKNDATIEDGIFGNFEKFNKKVQKLNYKEIKEQMKLINTQSFRLFFPFKLKISKYKIEEFSNKEKLKEYLDENENLDGKLIWKKFESLNEIKDYAKKEVKRSELNSLMQFFTFNITKYSDKQTLPHYDYVCGSYYLVSDHEEFIQNGKFNRKAYQEKSKDIFW